MKVFWQRALGGVLGLLEDPKRLAYPTSLLHCNNAAYPHTMRSFNLMFNLHTLVCNLPTLLLGRFVARLGLVVVTFPNIPQTAGTTITSLCLSHRWPGLQAFGQDTIY